MTTATTAPSPSLDRAMPGSLYRSYLAEMEQEFPGGPAPSFLHAMGTAISTARMFDGPERHALEQNLSRAHYHSTNRNNWRIPRHIGLPELLGVNVGRTMMGGQGAAGGFTIADSHHDVVVDKARTTQGPWSRCNIWEVSTREYLCPVVYETSRANGSRFGGFTSVWGLGELKMPAASDGKLAMVRFVQDRLLMYTTISRDLWADSASIARWLHYVGFAEFRAAVEDVMINGTTLPNASPLGIGPQGVITSPATVTVAKVGGQAALSIVAANIDALYGAIADGNTEHMVWHAGRDTVNAIDQLAMSGQAPELFYQRGTNRDNPNPWPTLKGKPLLTSEFCPATGNPGDLIAVDWSDYALTWMRPKPTVGGLELAIGAAPDMQHRGFVGMPEGSVEMRASDEILFTTDQLAIAWKVRMSGGFFWPTTMTTQSGHVVGPAAIVAQR